MRRSSDDYNDMIYAATREEIEKRRKAFIAKWAAQAPSRRGQLGGSRRSGSSPSPVCRKANGAAFVRRMQLNGYTRSSSAGSKTQTVLPSADTAAMLFWALLASGQINMRKVDGWQTLPRNPWIRKLISPHNML